MCEHDKDWFSDWERYVYKNLKQHEGSAKYSIKTCQFVKAYFYLFAYHAKTSYCIAYKIITALKRSSLYIDSIICLACIPLCNSIEHLGCL